ncbi:GGDEF domain-containing protein [Variovorax ginsengisoli]|uniref:Diguanylate cyclase (GGDEF)-like protein n=1 Tax=Variovorax ginsengisoli TaxID=363844 RepID=A0ABT9SFM6_9BURK|nr:GGDEF domain-containing protein [Variovorax ginsengisoli]MDP9902598.1 diguanylate cyclase (GGDEF)-like protein [Variovorax ginsengisoli]
MNSVPEVPKDPVAQAQERLDLINDRVATMRAVLVQLLQDIVQAESRLDRSQALQLQKVNENLVVSALAAQSDAKTANDALDELSRAAGIDPLTGLPNRTLLLDRLGRAIAHAKRHGNRVALLFLDLDGFKQINDRLGHAAGDQALQLVADCLRSLVRETYTVSRHGGDEFLILLSEILHPQDAESVARKVNKVLSSYGQFNIESGLTASIGISLYPDDSDDAKLLIELADAAMYRAKAQGRGGFVFHGYRPSAIAAITASTPEPLEPHEPVRPQQKLSVSIHDKQHAQLREANEALVLAALGAQELLAAAEDTRRRQADLRAMLAKELSDPFAPIRLAVTTLGMSGAEVALLALVQEVVEKQARKLVRMVNEVLPP